MSATISGAPVRQPRLKVLLNGMAVPALSAGVTQNGHYAADTFRAEFPLNHPQGQTLAWWGSQTTILADIQVQLDGANGYVSLIQGEIDPIDIDLLSGLVSVNGRDLTSRLIEAKTQETFLNQTASEVATTLAGRHGLTPAVTPTATLVSRYYQLDHDKLTLGQFHRTTTEWDLLTYLAQHEGYDVYVQGQELHFQPTQADTAPPFQVTWDTSIAVPQSNVIDLRLTRSLTLAHDIEVIVKSWNSATARGFQKIARLTSAKTVGGKGGTNTPPQQYVFIKPNMTQDQAQKFANARLADLSGHERVISFRMPGELTLAPRMKVALSGTNSSWDQAYFISEITRDISFDRGFEQSVQAKNHSTDSQVSIG